MLHPNRDQSTRFSLVMLFLGLVPAAVFAKPLLLTSDANAIRVARGGGGERYEPRSGSVSRSTTSTQSGTAAESQRREENTMGGDRKNANTQNEAVIVPYGSPTVIETTSTPTQDPSTVPQPSTSTTVIPGTNPPIITNQTPIPTPGVSAAQQQADQDLEITRNLQEQIMTAKPTANNIVVDTIDGVVVLSGTVETAVEKQNIENYAKSIPGVKRVDSSITIAPPLAH